MNSRRVPWMHLLQCADSAFPVGAFSFSQALETAAREGLVGDAAQLQTYVSAVMRQAAGTDGVAALQAHRAASCGEFATLVDIDRRLLSYKLNAEARLQTLRMGRKMAELTARITARALSSQWLEAIDLGTAHGTYPVGQAIAFAEMGMDEESLFAAHQYGVASTVLSAALRCLRVSHFQTQEILYRVGGTWRRTYEEVCHLELRHMHAFAPEMDILAAMHEKGTSRMFMN
jgi:urease accessory protein